jgi:hypothetical protein
MLPFFNLGIVNHVAGVVRGRGRNEMDDDKQQHQVMKASLVDYFVDHLKRYRLRKNKVVMSIDSVEARYEVTRSGGTESYKNITQSYYTMEIICYFLPCDCILLH